MCFLSSCLSTKLCLEQLLDPTVVPHGGCNHLILRTGLVPTRKAFRVLDYLRPGLNLPISTGNMARAGCPPGRQPATEGVPEVPFPRRQETRRPDMGRWYLLKGEDHLIRYWKPREQ